MNIEVTRMFVTEDLRNKGVDINITGLLSTDLQDPNLLVGLINEAVKNKAKQNKAAVAES
jgi:hypothetical protein